MPLYFRASPHRLCLRDHCGSTQMVYEMKGSATGATPAAFPFRSHPAPSPSCSRSQRNMRKRFPGGWEFHFQIPPNTSPPAKAVVLGAQLRGRWEGRGRVGARRPGKGLRNPRCYDGCLHRRCREGGRSRPRAGCRPERPRPAPPGRVGLPAAAAARPRSPHWVHFPKGPGEAGAEGQLRTALLLHGTCREASPWQLPFLPVLMIEQLRHGASLNL